MYRARARAGTTVWIPKRGADRNVVPVFSERLKKFKSNANEGEELNISVVGGGGGAEGEEGERGTKNGRMRNSLPRRGELRGTLQGGRSGGTVTSRISSGLTGGASR